MRKWLIASDLHGSAYYANALLDAYAREGAERLILLGDILYHGPRNDLPRDYAPKEVIALLSAYKNDIFAVRGNCDTEVDQMVLPFPILADYAVITAGNRTVYLTHGHKYGKDNPPPHKTGDIVLAGHTHVVANVDCGDFIYLNPGSPSLPKDEGHRGYLLLDEQGAVFCEMDGTVYREVKF